MSRETKRFLNHIVERFAADERRAIDRDANAAVPGADLEAEKRAAIEREHAAAEVHADAFAQGLHRAWERRQRGGTDITLDDRDPDENAMAAALIHHLVRFGLASSHSREVDDQLYAYVIAVDWDRLGTLAADNGQRLEEIVAADGG